MEWIAAAFVLMGSAFTLIAAIGLVKMKDVYTRMHAATKTGTLGLGLICLAALLLAPSWTARIEVVLIFVFMLVTAPIGAHLIGRAAFRAGVPFAERTRFEEGCGDFGRLPHVHEIEE
ncbi:monovalent cation/H(+) antiporter subunit G [Roseobacter sp. HKCCA0434]|uniref:monovalent cation/H(+) antiporter subunit G n=1 Tax=Roseobacter sp. HKCCA0434 TaxID=3079297 RepID=UPI0029058FE8|nr:monovalent cation/H(+) antiporter subunit G [Roseobacter sp. HKCCA0434]